ncbi:DUF87 domain-containing protein [Kineosporia sp. NBRC 101677]|uniref:VirB4 family type IV secretion system protein n=1 Tax=Kineosporia sp. NBRC 101677 TaxID=3032197 RepID=UPI00255565AD|nr:DUF87 domain-containing protein [Kineosporia sp. NBRC 101677]
MRGEHPGPSAPLANEPPADVLRDGLIDVAPDHLRVGGGWSASLMVDGFPAEVSMAWLRPLTSWPGVVDVSLFVDPIPAATATARIRRQRVRMESTRRLQAERGALEDPLTEAASQDAQDLADKVARGESRLFFTSVVLTVHARSREALQEDVEDLQAAAAAMLLRTHVMTWRQQQGWTSTLPLGLNQAGTRRIMDTDALAAASPLSSPDLPGPLPLEPHVPNVGVGGVLVGLNLASGAVVGLDRWSLDNHNMVVLARSGAGKSYAVKVSILRELYRGTRVAVIDPEREYLHLAERVGGTVIELGAPGVHLNPLTLPAGDPDAYTRRCLFLHTLVDVLLGEPLPPHERAVLDVAVRGAYARAGITADPRTWHQAAPTMRDLLAALQDQAEGTADDAPPAQRPPAGAPEGIPDDTPVGTWEGTPWSPWEGTSSGAPRTAPWGAAVGAPAGRAWDDEFEGEGTRGGVTGTDELTGSDRQGHRTGAHSSGSAGAPPSTPAEGQFGRAQLGGAQYPVSAPGTGVPGTPGAAATLAARLAPWVTGSFSRLFHDPAGAPPQTAGPDRNGHQMPATAGAVAPRRGHIDTHPDRHREQGLDPDQGHLVVWSTRLLAEELRPAGMLLAVDAIWRSVDRRTPPGRVGASTDQGLTDVRGHRSHNTHGSGDMSREDLQEPAAAQARPSPDGRAGGPGAPGAQAGARPRQVVVVDEASLLLSEPAGARFLARLAKTSRKRQAGLTLITPDVVDLLGSELGQVILANAASVLLLHQAPQAIGDLTRACALSPGEARFLTTARRGEGLLLAEGRVPVQIVASTLEHQIAAAPPRDPHEPA